MSEMKHFAVYNGQNQTTNTEISDQALHQVYLTPYESGLSTRRPRRRCARIRSGRTPRRRCRRPADAQLRRRRSARTRYSQRQNQRTWPLNESHFSCEQPLTLTYALQTVGVKGAGRLGLPGDAQHRGILQGGGAAEEPHEQLGFCTTRARVLRRRRRRLTPPATPAPTEREQRAVLDRRRDPWRDPRAGVPDDRLHARARRSPKRHGAALGLQPGAGEMLYQEQRFGLLGCDQTPGRGAVHEPRGVDGNRTGTAPLPTGPSSGATPTADMGPRTATPPWSRGCPRRARCCSRTTARHCLSPGRPEQRRCDGRPAWVRSTRSPIRPARLRSALPIGTRSTRWSSCRTSAATRTVHVRAGELAVGRDRSRLRRCRPRPRASPGDSVVPPARARQQPTRR